jgi:hypothetical protein
MPNDRLQGKSGENPALCRNGMAHEAKPEYL